MEVKAIYQFNDEFFDYHNFVYLNCKYDDKCIIGPDNIGTLGFSIPFASKTKCYEFINLISELREFYE